MSSNNNDQIKLNLNAPEFIPRSKVNSTASQTKSKTQFHQSYSTPLTQQTKLSINSKAFIPKFLAKKNTEMISKPETTKPKQKKVYKEYFVIDEDDKQQFNFDYDYMISFENWEICKETKLLTEEFLQHLKDFEIIEEEPIKQNNNNNKGKKKYFGGDKKNKEGEKKKEIADLKDFGRKDFSKEIALAEQFKKNIDKEAEKDPIKFQITELLNILTKDNYKTTSDQIYAIIENSIESQVKFLDVLFNKSVKMKNLLFLYMLNYAKIMIKNYHKKHL